MSQTNSNNALIKARAITDLLCRCFIFHFLNTFIMTPISYLRTIASFVFCTPNNAIKLLNQKWMSKCIVLIALFFAFSFNANSINTFGRIAVIEPATITAPPITVVLTTNPADCASGASVIMATVYDDEANPTGNYLYQWSYSADGGAFVNIPEQTTNTLVAQAAGTYSLTATNDMGISVSASTTVALFVPMNVNINIAQPNCDFYVLTPFVMGGVAPYYYTWSDGNTSSDVTATTAGTYTVTVTDAFGCTASATAIVPYGSFCPPFTFDLFNTGGPTISGTTPVIPGYNIVNYHIDYGDGNSFDSPQPISFIHDYTTSGTHTVCITITIQTLFGQLCYCTYCQNITTTDPCSQLSALELFQNGGLEIGINPPFSNTYNIVHYSFNFGDGTPALESDLPISAVHTYLSNGTYTVCITLTIQLPTGQLITCTVCKDALIGSCGLVPNYSFEEGNYPYPNAPNQINLTTHWFHPPSTSSSSDWYSNTFPGGYLLAGTTYNLMPHSGCKYGGFDLNTCEGLEIQLNQPINIGCTYNVDFWWTPRKTTTSNYEFWAVVGHNSCTTANSGGMCGHSCSGDMHVKVTVTPTHVPGTWYHFTGTYTNGVGAALNYVVFTGQMSVAPLNNYIYVDDVCFSLAPAPCEIHAALDLPSICNTVGQSIGFCPTFTVGCTTQATAAYWDFGDGTTYDQPLPLNCPIHTYATPGIYNVCFTITGTNGTDICSDTVCKIISVNAPAMAVGYWIDVCAGSSVTLNNTTPFIGAYYQWTLNGVPYGTFSTPDLTVTPTTTSDYTVNAYDANGCLLSSTQYYVAVHTAIATASSNSPVCVGSTINLAASGGTSYLWSGPNGYSSALQNPSRSNATTTKAGVYTVTIIDAFGCIATASTTVVVSPLPTATITGPSTICAGSSTTLTASGGSTYLWGNGSTSSTRTVTPTATTTYTVTITNAAGCTATASKTINVSPLPTATATVNCGNSNATITVNATGVAPLSYSLNGGTYQSSNVFSGLANGTYNITVKNANGCTKTIMVTVNCCGPLMQPTGLTNNINSPTSATLSWTAVQGACQYQIQYSKKTLGIWGAWTSLPTQTAISKTINGLQAGKQYKWRVKAICCNGTASAWSNEKTFTLPSMLLISNEPAAKTNENSKEVDNQLTVYPNPSSSFVTIDFYAEINQTIQIMLFDVTGKEAFAQTYTSTDNQNSVTLNLSTLSKGYYVIELNDGTTRKHAKLLIVR